MKSHNKNDYRCIHIFDWDDENKIKYLLGDRIKYNACDFNVEEIDKNSGDEFVDKWYINNDTCKADIYLALVKDNIIYQLIGISKHTKSNKFEYEVMCNVLFKNFYIKGGLNKLVIYFVNKFKPSSLCTYIDRSKFNEKEFKDANFKTRRIIKPLIWYVKNKERIKQTPYNNELEEQGYLPVADCGYFLMVYKNC